MKQRLLYTLSVIILLLFFSFNKNNVLSASNYIADLTLFVAPTKLGTGSGTTKENAADFLSASFWSSVKSHLASKSVKVQFQEGEYLRAYTEKPLEIESTGNATNKLILSGSKGVIFNAPADLNLATKSHLLRIASSQNVIIYNIHFTGHGKLNYAMPIRNPSSKNIIVDSCSWIDMRGIVYGASGCHSQANNVIYQNCTFKRIGATSGAHMIYNAYDVSRISVINCLFEDCPGDYVRFRDNADYCLVANSIFKRNYFAAYPERGGFISMPVFNDVNPGDEFFATNYAFYNNQFINNSTIQVASVFTFYCSGFTPPNYDYLLTGAEGVNLTRGTTSEKLEILQNNFGIDVTKIRISGNSYTGNTKYIFSITSVANYGSVSKGWAGTVDIENLIPVNHTPFAWEPTFSSSVNTIKENSLKFFVADNQLNVNISNPSLIGKMFIIHDITGKHIISKKIEDSVIVENIGNYPKGVYIINVERNSQKFIVK